MIERIRQEHFGHDENSKKMPLVFLMNNLNFIVPLLQILNLEKGAMDLVLFDRQLKQTIDKYLETLLAINFVDPHQNFNDSSQEPVDSGEDNTEDLSIGKGIKLRDL